MEDARKCPKCKHRIADDALRCIYCGEALDEITPRQDFGKYECPNCSAPLQRPAADGPLRCEFCAQLVEPIPATVTAAAAIGSARHVRQAIEELDVKGLKGNPLQLMAMLRAKGIEISAPLSAGIAQPTFLQRMYKDKSSTADKKSRYGCVIAALIGFFLLLIMTVLIMSSGVSKSRVPESEISNNTIEIGDR
ncbi:MAG: zinc ribbon domain-containing protein [Candidatus Alcyoniella australis]|nr:zinc ribbon domain-containing protein [Candidatus Alcyoniella australis]